MCSCTQREVLCECTSKKNLLYKKPCVIRLTFLKLEPKVTAFTKEHTEFCWSNKSRVIGCGPVPITPCGGNSVQLRVLHKVSDRILGGKTRLSPQVEQVQSIIHEKDAEKDLCGVLTGPMRSRLSYKAVNHLYDITVMPHRRALPHLPLTAVQK